MEWHKIMGHCNLNDLRKLQSIVEGMKILDDWQCECVICTQGKMCQFRSRKTDERAKEPLEFVNCDLASPINPVAKDGFKYTLSFVDDHTGINMAYFLKQKSDTVEAMQKFLADAAFFGKIKCIWSSNRTELMSKNFKSLLRENGIKHEMSALYSPHQNGREGVAKSFWHGTLFTGWGKLTKNPLDLRSICVYPQQMFQP